MATKMTYGEQLKHPFWQRRRLEMLEGAGWECTNCGAKETTLHVHHRQYIKGRLAWEYDDTELVVLCEDCHEAEHADAEVLKVLLAQSSTSENTGLVGGFLKWDDTVDPGFVESARQTDAMAFAAGFVAYLTHALGDIELMHKVAAYAASLASENAESRLVFEQHIGNTFGSYGERVPDGG